MNDYPGPSIKRRSVAQVWIFFPLCLVAATSLLCTPPIGARQSTGRNHPFVFRGHYLHVASAEAARWFISEDGQVSILPQPVPIPGGINLPPVIHVFAPTDLDTEPTVITNFKGFSALAYPTGTNAARDSNGNFYDVSNDMRVFQGEYVAADGSHHRGTFVFI